jgi:hypothetical protein
MRAVPSTAVAGFDWGARTANIVAALWPEPKLIWRTASPEVELRRRDVRAQRGVVRQP